MPLPLNELQPVLTRYYEEVLTNMLRNESIWSARMQGYKRTRAHRPKWKFRIHTKMGRFLAKIGYWHLLDYIAFMGHIAKEAWSIKEYDYYRLSDD